MITIRLPLEVWIPRKTGEDKRIALNLNIYRNAHHYTLNKAKEIMKEVVIQEINRDMTPPVLGKGPWQFTYTIFPATGRAFDLGNVCSIVQKFTDDALVECGVLIDDNYKIVRRCIYAFGGIDKEDPRAELTITAL